MASNPQDVRQAALKEMARREMQRRQQAQGQSGPFVGPVPTGAEIAASRPPAPKRPSLWDTVMMTAPTTTKAVLEPAMSIASGMVSSPANALWNAGMEALELPTGQPVGTYIPRSREGQAVLTGIDKTMRLTGIPQAIEAGLDLDSPDPRVRATGNLMEGAAGILPAVGSVKAMRSRRAAAVPTREAIRAASREAYARAEQTGGVLPSNSLGGFVTQVEKMLADEGFDRGLNPKTSAALQRLYDEATRPGVAGHSAQGAEVIRRVLLNAEKEARASSAPGIVSDDVRLTAKLVDDFDDFIDNAMPSSTSEYRTARALWNTQRKAQEIETLFERAENRAGQYSISGKENALTTEFRQLAQNPRRLGRFTPEEQAAIRQVAQGSLTQNALRFLGKFSPRGGIQSLATYGALAIDPVTGALMAGAGEASRLGATALRIRSANNVDRLVRSGANRHMAPRAVPGEPARGLGYLPANALATQEAANALYQLDEPRRNALTRRR